MEFIKNCIMALGTLLIIVCLFALPIGFLALGQYWFGDVSFFVTIPLLISFIVAVLVALDN